MLQGKQLEKVKAKIEESRILLRKEEGVGGKSRRGIEKKN